MTNQNITSNYLSNISFIQKYNKNIFGLTGTLGTPESLETLKKIFKLDFALIPTYK